MLTLFPLPLHNSPYNVHLGSPVVRRPLVLATAHQVPSAATRLINFCRTLLRAADISKWSRITGLPHMLLMRLGAATSFHLFFSEREIVFFLSAGPLSPCPEMTFSLSRIIEYPHDCKATFSHTFPSPDPIAANADVDLTSHGRQHHFFLRLALY